MTLQAAPADGRQQAGSLRGLQHALVIFGFAMVGTIIGLVGYGLWVAHDRALASAALETGRLSRVLEQHTAQTVEVIDRALATAYVKTRGLLPRRSTRPLRQSCASFLLERRRLWRSACSMRAGT